jgi:hypothetical protein
LNEFTFVARITSFLCGFQKVVLRCTLADDSDSVVKFSPCFYWLEHHKSMEKVVRLNIGRAWSTPLGVFLFVANPRKLTFSTLFVSADSPQLVLLKSVLNRLNSDDNPEKSSLFAWFWRLNVLR